MLLENDVIAAIASGCTDSGIGIIRLSGEGSLEIAAKVFKPVKEQVNIMDMKTYTAHFGHIIDPDSNTVLDECVLLYMKSPHSYTGEDTVEIDAHGGMYICNRILALLCKQGARMAEPGEYTKRAFLNGRMDLTQAEAGMDVIHADNENALSISMKQLRGELKNQILDLRERIIHENAYIEYALDDPEHVSLDGFSEKLDGILDEIIISIQNLIDHANEGRMMKEGIKTVIVGTPNAGKSSLLNVLLKEERAIVTNVPGTTRDTLEERCMVGGMPLNIIDTAGIHETSDIVEKIGVDKAKDVISSADLILYVIDQSESFKEDENEIIDLIKDKKVIVLLNKCDLEQKLDLDTFKKKIDAPMIHISMKQNQAIHNFSKNDIDKNNSINISNDNNNVLVENGMNIFIKTLQSLFFEGRIKLDEQTFVTNERQKNSLERAIDSLKRVKESIALGMSEDFFTIDLLDAYEQLGMIIGESVHDDLVNQIFKEFCTGK